MSFLAAGCDLHLPGKPNPAQRPVPANEVVDFGVLFRENCTGCHAADGKLGPAPPLNDPVFLAIVPDATLHRVIADGRPGTLMPAFAQERGGTLTAAQVKVLAEGLKKQWRPAEELKPQPPPYETAAGGNAERGAKAFGRACAVCHGAEGEGGSAKTRINDPVFLALISDQALRRLAITGWPDFGMPDFAGKRPDDPEFKPLTTEEVTDLTAYMASWRQPAKDKKPSK